MTIVVTGRREQQPDGSFVVSFYTQQNGVPGTRFYSPRQVPEDGSAPEPTIEVSVAIEKTLDSTNPADLEQAARELAKAILEVVTALGAASPFQQITVLGRTMTVSDYLGNLNNTEFTVTDRVIFNNPGVGSADYRGGTSPNLESINYRAIIGNGPGTNYYADPAYPDNAGMHILVMHETAHMTQVGYDFFIRSAEILNNDPSVPHNDFYATPYGPNNESFADAVANAMATAAGMNLHGASTGNWAAPVNPEDIYQQNNGAPYPGP